MSRITEMILEPSVTYTGNTVLVRVKVQDDYKYKKLLVSENMKYTTATGKTFALTNAVSTNNASILRLEGNTTQNGTPTPSNPVEIKTVSGDNEVVVCGENRFNKSNNIVSGYTFGGTGNLVSDSGFWYQNYFIGVEPSTTYYFSGSKELNVDSLRVCEYTADKTFIKRNYEVYTITTSATTRFIRVSNRNGKLDTLMISTSPITTYEPYVGNSYRVDFGGKNLLNNTATTQTINGITFTVNSDKSVTINGTATATTWLILNSSISLKAGTYTMSQGNTTNTVRVYCSALSGYCSNGVRTKTITETKTSDIAINIPNGTTVNNLTLFPMVEEGSIATEYSPYVANPLYFPEINGYRNKLKRAEGKNLCDSENATIKENYAKDDNGNEVANTGGNYTTSYTKVLPNTKYTLSYNVSSVVIRLYYYDENKNWISRTWNIKNSSNYYTFTTPNNCHYMQFQNVVGFGIAQLELGETATSYEPYGNNWYIEKNIGKVVLNGTQNITLQSINSHNIANFLITFASNYTDTTKYTQMLTDRFTKQTSGISTTTTEGFLPTLNSSINVLGVYLRINSSRADTTSTMNTWLSNNNTTVYYVLSTPTYEIITNENLIQQLNAIQNIELIENLCYVDWVGTEKPTMTLQYPTNETLNAYITTEDNKLIRTEWGV